MMWRYIIGKRFRISAVVPLLQDDIARLRVHQISTDHFSEQELCEPSSFSSSMMPAALPDGRAAVHGSSLSMLFERSSYQALCGKNLTSATIPSTREEP